MDGAVRASGLHYHPVGCPVLQQRLYSAVATLDDDILQMRVKNATVQSTHCFHAPNIQTKKNSVTVQTPVV